VSPSQGVSSISKLFFPVSGLTCAQANSPAALANLTLTMVSTLQVPAAWVTASAVCASRRLAARSLGGSRALQTGVSYVITIVVPASATAAQTQTFTTNFVSVTVLSPTDLTMLLSTTLTAAGNPAASVLSVEATVNGQSCSGAQCASLIEPPSPAASVNIGAIIGGVIGAVVVVLLIAVASCRVVRDRKKQAAEYTLPPPEPSQPDARPQLVPAPEPAPRMEAGPVAVF